MSKQISLRLSDRSLLRLHSIKRNPGQEFLCTQKTMRVKRCVQKQCTNGKEYTVNPGKRAFISVGGYVYRRVAIQTHVLLQEDNLTMVAKRYAQPLLQLGDVLFLSEKAVACTQHRAIPLSEIHPRPLARLLCKFVKKNAVWNWTWDSGDHGDGAAGMWNRTYFVRHLYPPLEN